MKYRVLSTRRVDREIARIAQWYLDRSGSPKIADAWVTGFRAAAQRLESAPESHPLARETSDFDFDVHELLYGSGRKKTHRILFRIDDNQSLVQVIGVRHYAQRDFTPDDM